MCCNFCSRKVRTITSNPVIDAMRCSPVETLHCAFQTVAFRLCHSLPKLGKRSEPSRKSQAGGTSMNRDVMLSNAAIIVSVSFSTICSRWPYLTTYLGCNCRSATALQEQATSATFVPLESPCLHLLDVHYDPQHPARLNSWTDPGTR
jgi:hypothetical protein